MKHKNTDKADKAEEPLHRYDTNASTDSIHIFGSITEQEEEHYKYLAGLTPEQHLHNVMELIKRIFASDLNNHKTTENRIYFD